MATWRITELDGKRVVKTVPARAGGGPPHRPLTEVELEAELDRRIEKAWDALPAEKKAALRAAHERRRLAKREGSAAHRLQGLLVRDTGGHVQAVLATDGAGNEHRLRDNSQLNKDSEQRVSFRSILEQDAWNGVEHERRR